MYSRRFYGTDRTQRSRPLPMPQTSFERSEPAKKPAEKSVSEPLPIMALDIPLSEESTPVLAEYPDPKDFLPEATESRAYSESKGTSEISEVSVFPENTPEIPEVPDTENDISANAGITEDTTDVSENTDETGDTWRSVRNMTFEDMVLTGLLMLGSSGEYDDDIMLMLGLILMMGA